MRIFCGDIDEVKFEKNFTPLNRNEVHAWLVDSVSDHNKISNFLSSFNEDEKKRASRFVFEKDRYQYISAHGALRDVLSRYVGIDASQVQFRKSITGKPFLSKPHTNLEFNISHSGDKILIGIAHSPLGVDIEMIKNNFAFDEVSNVYFSEKEKTGIKTSVKPQETFLRFWTRKEAILKASGSGISEEITRIIVCDRINNSILPQDYHVNSFRQQGFLAAIASRNAPHRILFHLFSK